MVQNKIPHPIYLCIILIALTIVVSFVTFDLIPKIPQWASYHHFADTRLLWGIPNFSNVVSNIPFFIVSILGFFSLRRQFIIGNLVGKEAIVFLTLFIGIFLIGIGSSYYH